MTTENLLIYMKWANHGLRCLEEWKKRPRSKTLKLEVEMSAAVCAYLDRKHSKKATQTLQEYVWRRAYLAKEVSYERYYESGYFDEKFEKTA